MNEPSELTKVFKGHNIQGYQGLGIVTAVYADGGFQFSKGDVIELVDIKVKHLDNYYKLVTRGAKLTPSGTCYKWCCLNTGAEKGLSAFIAR